ncbi:hypothetical protein Bca52824_093476 [Brassica carinata]|uniref:Leucine-rich repeat-containing N-terminal plant-type domain-containing protein n=1 Tax=Brassica carinata TaxID=52824 RepID=A0A8X7P7D5_BRACI|nr:hypothetical protein Bca52824_093476 [Brassica carinata]
MQNLRWVLNLLFVSSLLHNLVHSSSQVICSSQDRAALLAFKSSIVEDTTGVLSSWVGQDCCNGDWEGVLCNPATGKVTSLVLQSSLTEPTLYMKGTLSPSLGSLGSLLVLVISGNKFITGSIPSSFSNLTSLTQLALEDNSLRGSVPTGLGHLPMLESLSLAGNRFSGAVPASLGSLRSLSTMSLARNSLSGPVPVAFKNLLKLQILDLSFNLLSGPIPDFVGQFRDLTTLHLSSNRLSGGIPVSVYNLGKLQDMSLERNDLTGPLSDGISNLQSLSILDLSSNKFTGHIPASITRLQNLWSLNLSRNHFSDPLPVVVGRGFPSLLSIDLSYNNLNLGARNLSKLTRPHDVTSLDLSENFLTGDVSALLANMTSLQKLKLSKNQLRFDLSKLKLPEGLAGSLSSLLNNKTSRFLEEIHLTNNQISGRIPDFAESLNLKVLNIGSNKIGGQIPSSISNLVELVRLDISRNHITGVIPQALGQLAQLNWLDLSINALTGRIPDSLLNIKAVKHASFRANRLCGLIPQGRPFNIFPAAAYLHNLCLCGKPLPPCMKTEK